MSVICTKNDWTCLASFTFICLVTIIVVPFSIHITYKFYNIGRHQAIVRRYPFTLAIASILAIVYIFLVIQYKLMCIVIGVGIVVKIHLWIDPIISRPFFILIVIIHILRIWLISYDLNQNVIQSRHEWQSLLRAKVIGDDWYSQNRHKWGNWKYLSKILFPFWIFLSILCTTPLFLSHTLPADLVFFSITILLLLCTVAIWHNMPPFKDTFYIVKEIKLLILSSLIYCVVWFSLMFWVKHGNIFHLMQIFTLFLFVFSPIFISEFMVIHMVNTINPKHVKDHKNICKAKTKSLFNVLVSSDIGIEEYLKHLQHECSTENILFFIEIIQWMYAETNREWSKYDTSPFSPQHLHFEFAKMIPTSSINAEEGADWYSKIQKIYTKYVHTSAEYQLNLPYTIYNEFTQLIRLYKMKQEIESGTFVIKLKKIKSKPSGSQSPRPRKTSLSFMDLVSTRIDSMKSSKSDSIKNRDTLRSTLRKIPSTIIEEKEHEPRSTPTKRVRFNSHPSIVSEGDEDANTIDTIKPSQSITITKDTMKLENIFNEVLQQASPVSPRNGVDLDITIQKPVDSKAESTIELDNIYGEIIVQVSSQEQQSNNANESVSTRKKPHERVTLLIPDPTTTESDNTISKTQTNEMDSDEDEPIGEHKVSPTLHLFLDDVLPYVNDEIDLKKNNETEDALDIDVVMFNRSTSRGSNPTRSKSPPHLSSSRRQLSHSPTPTSLKTPVPKDPQLSPTLTYDVARNLSIQSRTRTTIFNKAIVSLHRFTTQRSTMSKPISEFIDDDEVQAQYKIDPEEQKQMETATSVNLSHFVSISCFALQEVLMLNYQSVARFKRSSYFQTFNDNVNLDHLLLSVPSMMSMSVHSPKKDKNNTK